LRVSTLLALDLGLDNFDEDCKSKGRSHVFLSFLGVVNQFHLSVKLFAQNLLPLEALE
jgi:hypothetical protein